MFRGHLFSDVGRKRTGSWAVDVVLGAYGATASAFKDKLRYLRFLLFDFLPMVLRKRE